ncbi:hypothetical protein TRFO_05665 [Tritrichomonas foetus]|uniref:Uncharacterized protein n=1 Tax=Tritrichomonas foetus TaxID=1144522 RepID=A0A1J4K8J1_9EUKA|nr:hypothetical protein TRFO_05665 [Tritrichomonas foetus]|eukprot:OHT06028.1 hypothetical protein TRFO_05665 [Tritrichomonas foetus]
MPTHYAAERSHLDVLRFLIETKGADINAKDKFGMTPLHVACEHCNLDIVTYLLEHGAEMSYDNLGRSPADVAAEKGQVDVLRNFATKNPTLLTTPNNNNQTVVHFAAMSNFNEEIEFLTTIPDIDFNKVDNFGMAPLHYAAEHNNVNAITSLLAVSGINKTIETKPQGNTPLHVAAIYGQEEAATVLISPNIDLNNAVNSDQQSPLHLAACNGHYKTVCSLMKSGLDANLIDKNGRSPREAAKGTYSKQIVSALNGKQVNVGNPCEPEPYKSNTVAPEATAQTQSQGGGCNIA